MRRWHATTNLTLIGVLQPPRQHFSSFTRRLASNTDLSPEIETLRRQERLALFQLREHADTFIRGIERILAVVGPASNPAASLLSPTTSGRKQYICTERHNVSSRTLELGAALIEHAREIQEHCKDLEQEPYRDQHVRNPHHFDPRHDETVPDFVALELEEKARKTEIVTRLQHLNKRSDMIKRVIQVAERNGLAEANAYLKQIGRMIHLDPAPSPQLRSKSAPAENNSSLLHADWDDLQQQVDMQLEDEETASKKGD